MIAGYECQAAYGILFRPGIAPLRMHFRRAAFGPVGPLYRGVPGSAADILHKRPSMKTIITFILCLMLTAASLRAETVDLYLGEAVVEDQSAGERERGMAEALSNVLLKLSGLHDFSAYPQVQAGLQRANSMVITFYYRKQPFKLPDGSEGEQLRLAVRFSPQPVDQLAQALELPRWKRERRPLEIWLVVDDGLSRRILPIELEYAWQNLQAVADYRGMPVTFPSADEDGQYAVDPQLLWGGYTDELQQDGPVNALVIAARREGPEWNIRMNLSYGGHQASWRNRGQELQLELAAGMHQAIDEIVALNTIAAVDQGQTSFTLMVSGIIGSADYIRCLDYLQGLSLVERVDVIRAQQGRVEFSLALNAQPEYLLRSLSNDGVLTAGPKGKVFVLQP